MGALKLVCGGFRGHDCPGAHHAGTHPPSGECLLHYMLVGGIHRLFWWLWEQEGEFLKQRLKAFVS